MNKSIIISESVKAYFSSHASLAAIGRKVKKLKLFEPITQKVKIAQKTVKYSPVREADGRFHHPVDWRPGDGGSQQAPESRSRLAASLWTHGAALNNRWFKIRWMLARPRT